MCEAYSWGSGIFGRLGLGSETDTDTPVQIGHALKGTELTAAGAGWFHSCVVTAAGEVFGFGSNATGCLGGQTEGTTVPRRISGFPSSVRIVQVACCGDLAGAYSLALSDTGRVFAWGHPVGCGLGSSTTPVLEPQMVTKFVIGNAIGNFEPPVVTQVAGGGMAGACVASDGGVYTWGSSADGRLGYRGSTVQWRPRRVDSLVHEMVRSVAVGNGHMAATSSAGSLFVWGLNDRGQLGIGSLTPSRVFAPRRVHLHAATGAGTGAGVRAVAVACGERHTLAIDAQGRVFAWGGGGGAALGRGGVDEMTKKNRAVTELYAEIPKKIEYSWTRPQQVLALEDHRVVKISAGASTCLALTDAGLLFHWGATTTPATATATATASGIPRLVRQTPHVAMDALVCGAWHNVGLGSVAHPALTALARALPDLLDLAERLAAETAAVRSREGTQFRVHKRWLETRLGTEMWTQVVEPQLEGEDSLLDVLHSVHHQSATATATATAAAAAEVVPEGARFARYSARVLHNLFFFVYTDVLPPTVLPLCGQPVLRAPVLEDEDELQALGRLAACLGLKRLMKILDQRLVQLKGLSSFTLTLIPASSLSADLAALHRAARGGRMGGADVRLLCADGSVWLHSLMLLAADSLTQISAFTAYPRTLVQLCVDFLYLEIPPTESSLETLVSALKVAEILGSKKLVACLEDLLVERVSAATWFSLLSVAVSSQSSLPCAALREAAIAHVQRPLFRKALASAKQRTGSAKQQAEGVSEVVQKAAGGTLESLRRRWPRIYTDVISRLERDVGTAFKADATVQSYLQKLKAEEEGREGTDGSSSSAWKAMNKEIQREPSLLATLKDFAVLVALIAVLAGISKYSSFWATLTDSLPVGARHFFQGTGGIIAVVAANLIVGALVFRSVTQSLGKD